VTALFMVDLATDSHYALLGVAPDATVADIRAARDDLIRQLRERQRREPTNRDELIEKQKAINAAGEDLVRPARREQYDRTHAHLRLFSVRVAAAAMFVDRANLLSAIARAVEAHLDAAGTPVRPATDLYRFDFPDDLTPDPLLDDPTPARDE
jgi:curved DNA-binding protein CbpA